MVIVTELPVEILWSLLKECPRELRSVNKGFYRLHNELYRKRVLKLLDRVDENEFWNCTRRSLRAYVKSLDFLRKDSRLVVSIEGGIEFLDDSWYIIYNALLGPLKCENRLASLPVRDTLDYQKHIFTGHCIVPPEVPSNINAWFYIDDLDAARKLATLATEFRDSPYERYQTVSTIPNIVDFITETGVYCFNLGKLPRFEDRGFPTSLEVRLVERSMTPPHYFESPFLEFLGYDFNDYDPQSWLFFRIDSVFRTTVFNPYETMLAQSLVRFSDTFKPPEIKVELPPVEKGYFDMNHKAIRRFKYRYPGTRQNLQEEKTLHDWRTPRLKR